jgi:opacity protein-like surface antigen
MKTTAKILAAYMGAMAGLLPEIGQATESPSYYWRGYIGGVYMPDVRWKDPHADGEVSFDGGPGLSLAVGASLGIVPVRAELEWLYQANGISHVTSDQPSISPADWASVSLSGLMFNGYIDFKNYTPITPYLMAGFGYGYYGIELEADNAGSTTVSIFQTGIGIQYDLKTTCRKKYAVILDAGYRFVTSSDPEIDEALGGIYKTEYTSHMVMVGVRFKFIRKNSKGNGMPVE